MQGKTLDLGSSNTLSQEKFSKKYLDNGFGSRAL